MECFTSIFTFNLNLCLPLMLNEFSPVSLNFRICVILVTQMCSLKPSWVVHARKQKHLSAAHVRQGPLQPPPLSARTDCAKKPECLWTRKDGAVKSTAVAASTANLKECGKVEHRTLFFGLWLQKASTTCYKWKLKKWGKRRKAEELGKIKC